jgi:hypothetical protein
METVGKWPKERDCGARSPEKFHDLAGNAIFRAKGDNRCEQVIRRACGISKC